MNRLILLLALLATVGCSTDPLNDRTFTRADAESTPDDGTGDLGDDRDSGPDDGADTGTTTDPDLGGGLCRPNHDGLIERSEVTLQAGLSAKFATARDTTWDTAGADVDGVQTWDLAQSFASDQNVLVELRDPAGQWFETTFPTADYFTPLSTNSDLLGVFEVTDDAVLLLGVVTPEDGVFRTELEYDPPVPVLQFPLEEGDSWSVETDVSGVYEGVVSVYTETYSLEVDGSGSTQTPYGTFDTLRVRSVLERQVGLLTTVIRSFSFVTECFGTIATVASQEDESNVEFSDVAELRRLAP